MIFPDIRREGPTDLFAKILKQKESCSALLEKKNELIATLEDEIREADNQYKRLIEQYHENTSVMSNRMEYQVSQSLDFGIGLQDVIASTFSKQNTRKARARNLIQLSNLASELLFPACFINWM